MLAVISVNQSNRAEIELGGWMVERYVGPLVPSASIPLMSNLICRLLE